MSFNTIILEHYAEINLSKKKEQGIKAGSMQGKYVK
jgi:hypothetical protein